MVLQVASPASCPALPLLQLKSRSFLLVRLDITPCRKNDAAPLMLRWPRRALGPIHSVQPHSLDAHEILLEDLHNVVTEVIAEIGRTLD